MYFHILVAVSNSGKSEEILEIDKDGSFATQANRETQLLKFGDDLLAKGFYVRNIHQLKAKHIYHMLAAWKSEVARDLNPGPTD